MNGCGLSGFKRKKQQNTVSFYERDSFGRYIIEEQKIVDEGVTHGLDQW